MPNRRVLVVDDSHETREALGELLRRNGYAVETASNGENAIERLKSTPIDAILLDLQMPGSDGFDTLNYLREHRRGLPTILLSGMSPDQIQLEMLRKGTEALPPFFQKPGDYDQILAVLEMLLTGTLPPSVE